MKNTFIFIVAIVIIIFVILLSKFYWAKDINNEVQSFNLKYETYLDMEIYGNEIATLINKAVDDNEKRRLKKDDENYINIDINMKDLGKETIIGMDLFYNGGIDRFANLYKDINFKCTKIKYSKTGKVNYLLFEQMNK